MVQMLTENEYLLLKYDDRAEAWRIFPVPRERNISSSVGSSHTRAEARDVDVIWRATEPVEALRKAGAGDRTEWRVVDLAHGVKIEVSRPPTPALDFKVTDLGVDP